jgi:hypothetical protein
LERLRPSHKADYRTVLGEQALKREECTPGTRVKILEDITKWVNDPSSASPRVFWLTGQAGSGKTTIAYTITKHFGNGGNAHVLNTVLGGNFLCSRQFEETRAVTRIVPSIAYQLARKSKPYADALHDDAEIFDAVYHDVPTQLKDLLIEPWQRSIRGTGLPLYLIVIDALDEIKGDGGSTFLQDLITLIDEYDLRGFKFFVTSRPDPELVRLCKFFRSEAVCWLQYVPIKEAELDIKTYLEAKLPKLASSPELAELVRQADGLFIYAATAVKYLTPHRSITVREQIKMLKHLLCGPFKPASASNPTSLIDALYRQIMCDAFSVFEDEFLTCRLQILYTFLCTAERTSTSIAAALVAEGDDDIALAVAEGLHAVLYTQGDRVFWYHSSFPDFIFDPLRSDFDSFTFSCNGPSHHELLGETCFRIMKTGLRFNMGDIKSSFLFDSDTAEALSEKVNNNISGVLKYSIRHWTHHLPSPQLVNTDELRFCISEFLQIRILFWIEAMNLLKLRSQCTPMLQHAREWVLKVRTAYVLQQLLMLLYRA